MNLLHLIQWPWWTMWAAYGIAGLVVLIVLGSLKSLIGWPGLAALAIVLAFAGGALYGANRALDWTHAHYKVKAHATDLLSVFF